MSSELVIQSDELDLFYQDAARRARRRVKSAFDVEVLPIDSPDFPGKLSREEHGKKNASVHSKASLEAEKDRLLRKWREVWSVTIPNFWTEGDDLHLIVAIPFQFPDRLPKVYLTSSESAEIGIVPHLGLDRSICAFDEADVVTNIESGPGDIVLSVIERACGILQEGREHNSADDFDEEFAAYWGQESSGIALSLIKVGNEHKQISVCATRNALGAKQIFGDSVREIRHWAQALGKSVGTPRPALYLPLPSIGHPPFPKTLRELWQRLGETAPKERELLQDFLAQKTRPAGVLFSVESLNGERVLGAWWHLETIVPGFRTPPKRAKSFVRRADLRLAREVSGPTADESLGKMAIERVDGDRLYARTSGTVGKSRTLYQGRVNIIGCGALGSQIAHLMARCGAIESFILIDPQTLGIENVMRHQCPMSSVGRLKAEALAYEIQRQFPHVQCKTENQDILHILRKNHDALQGASLSIIAVGDLAVERRLNRLVQAHPESFDHPLCFVAIEPLALGGHAWWQRPGAAGCFECAFDEGLQFLPRIVADSSNFSRREAGCQTTHVPYGGADLATFIAAFGRFILTAPKISEDGNASLLWHWAGDLNMARENGIALHNPFELPDFSTHIEIAPFLKGCAACH